MRDRPLPRTLADWLRHQENSHPRGIVLGLDRVREVWRRMGDARPAPCIVTVGGTNGKGSTVAMIEAVLRAAGRRVGAYTSPHLLRYNERVRIDGRDVDDEALIAAFGRIERARGEIPLTYFEFGTLAALDLFARAGLDAAVLEVGLGGRLDAVNLIDADVAVITTVDLDHMEWLGEDRDAIGREKAGIVRAGRPAVIGELHPPHGLLDAAHAAGAVVWRAGQDFGIERSGEGWHFWHRDGTRLELPVLPLAAPVQYANAASALAGLHALDQAVLGGMPLAEAAARGLRAVRVPGRLQALGGDPALFVDVGHNPQAARVLATWLDTQPRVPTQAVFGALSDKDVGGVIAALGPRIDHWQLASLDGYTPRGLPAAALARALGIESPSTGFTMHADVGMALRAARAATPAGGRILAFGSFFVVAAVLG